MLHSSSYQMNKESHCNQSPKIILGGSYLINIDTPPPGVSSTMQLILIIVLLLQKGIQSRVCSLCKNKQLRIN
jgi:hypothetical protein